MERIFSETTEIKILLYNESIHYYRGGKNHPQTISLHATWLKVMSRMPTRAKCVRGAQQPVKIWALSIWSDAETWILLLWGRFAGVWKSSGPLFCGEYLLPQLHLTASLMDITVITEPMIISIYKYQLSLNTIVITERLSEKSPYIPK